MRRERGAAMLIALGGLALVAALAAGALSLSVAPLTRAHAAVERAKAERIAEGALHRLAAAMTSERERALAPLDGTVIETRYLGAGLILSGQDVAGLIDLNAAPRAVLQRLIAAAGAPAEAAEIAGIWSRATHLSTEAAVSALPARLRPAGRAALPHLTVWSERQTVDPWRATAPALAAAANLPLEAAQAFVAARALRRGRVELPPEADGGLLSVSEAMTVRVTAQAETEGGGRARLTAVIRVSDSPRAPVRFLSWR